MEKRSEKSKTNRHSRRTAVGKHVVRPERYHWRSGGTTNRAPEDLRRGSHQQIEAINLNQTSTSPTIRIEVPEFKSPLKFLFDTGAAVSLVQKSEISQLVPIDDGHIIFLKGITPQ